jgi:hypothetical protein
MPLGRLVGTSDLKDLADRGIVGERIYLKGQFVVNFADANRAVLRPRTGWPAPCYIWAGILDSHHRRIWPVIRPPRKAQL